MVFMFDLNIILPNSEAVQNLSKVKTTRGTFGCIFWQVLRSMYGKDNSDKIGLILPLFGYPQLTICKSIKHLYNVYNYN